MRLLSSSVAMSCSWIMMVSPFMTGETFNIHITGGSECYFVFKANDLHPLIYISSISFFYTHMYSSYICMFLAATKQLYEWYFLSVCLSVTPFWLCSHHRIIMKFSGVITSDRSDVHAKGQGQRSKVKVTEVTTQLYRFRTVTPVWIHIWWWNDAYSLIMLRRGALLFLAATKQLYEWFSPSVCLSVCPSVRPSVRPSVCHTFLTMFPSSYHHEIFRTYYQWQKWRPCKRSRSEVKGQGHRGHDPT